MTTGTLLAFIFSGITVPVAIVSGIWVEARMPVPDPQRLGSPRPSPASYPADPRQPAPERLIRGRHPR